MSTNCKNCDNTFQGNFCNNCGQTAHTHAINMHYLWHDIQHGIFHVDSGIFYTIKELFLRPGITIRNFIEGKRVAYFKPVAMIFLLATIYGLLYHYFHIEMPVNEKSKEIMTAINDWMGSHYALCTLLYIPLYTVGSYLAFKKSSYNFMEHGVMNLYLGSMKTAMNLALFPLLYIYNNTDGMGIALTISFLLDILLTAYTYYNFFNGFSKSSRIFRIILSTLYTFALIGILIVIAIVIIILFTSKK